MTRKQEFFLRPATNADLPSIRKLADAEGMEGIPDIVGITVAVDGAGNVIGFIRLLLGYGEHGAGIWHVNPIITAPSWRGHGVGKVLIDDALDKCGELRLVARGNSRGFYEAIGFQVLDWDDICTLVGHDCDGCPIIDECNPCPMGKVL